MELVHCTIAHRFRTVYPRSMIETERLTLRLPTVEDFNASLAMRTDPIVQRFIGNGEPAKPEDVWTRLLRNIGHWSALGYGLFAVVERQSGRFIGEAGLADFHRGLGKNFDPFPEVAWAMASDTHGKGFATEAAMAALKWFDETRGAGRTVCIIDSRNTASLRVAEKVGYIRYGSDRYKDHEVELLERFSR